MLLFFTSNLLKSLSEFYLSRNLLHLLKHLSCVPDIPGQSHDAAINLVGRLTVTIRPYGTF